MKKLTILYCLFIIIISSCQDQEEVDKIIGISNIVVSDNGNIGNGADIEVNFEKQVAFQLVSHYKIFALKSQNATNFDLKMARSLDNSRYAEVSSSNIYPLNGKRLSPTAVDVDGDLIKSNVAYRFAVISIPKDEEVLSPNLNISSEDFVLSQNNQVNKHSDEMGIGAGSLAIDSKGDLLMADYNIVGQLGNFTDSEYQMHRIRKDGHTSPYHNKLSLLGGNFVDKQDVLYQSLLTTDGIIKITEDGSQSIIPIENVKFSGPDGIFVNEEGEIFIAASLSGKILKISTNGIAEEYAITGGRPRGITGDNNGNLYVSLNQEDGSIIKIDATRNVSTFAQVPTFKPDTYLIEYLMWVGYLKFYKNNLYVAGQSTDRIYKINMEGEVSVFAGSGIRLLPRGGARTANFNRPIGIAFSPETNRMYVSGCLDIVPQHTQASTPSQVYEIELLED